jgi:hypothetical protein
VACGAEEEPTRVLVVGLVLCAYGVVRAQLARIQGGFEVVDDAAPGLHQSTERAFAIGRAGVDEDAVACLSGVDTLSDGAGWIAAFERDGCKKLMRKAMEHHVGKARKL